MPRKCKFIEGTCKVRASFNFPNQPLAMFCKTHSEPGMINVNALKNLCQKCNLKQPSYGLPGNKAISCSSCATEDMVDLVSKLCEEKGCTKNPTRGFLGGKPIRCKTHALEGMIDIKNRKCIICVELKVENPKQCTFGITKATHCLKHKTEDMVDFKHKTETCEKCTTRATYGFSKPVRCSNHKIEGMKDIVSYMCEKCGVVQGVFGLDDKLYCKYCKTDEMKNIKARMCQKCNLHQPVFNFKNEKKGIFCNSCKLDNMIDVVNPKCISCGLFTVSRKKQYCVYCTPKSDKYQKTHEMKVVNFLEKNEIKFTHNKSIGYTCGGFRPDISIDSNTHFVIVEIDENQHKQYEQKCEIIRMLNIHQAIGMKCVFLRYNPDIFRIKNRARKIDDVIRLNNLLEEVKKHMQKIPEQDITVYKLYYDNDTGNHIEYFDILSKEHLI